MDSIYADRPTNPYIKIGPWIPTFWPIRESLYSHRFVDPYILADPWIPIFLIGPWIPIFKSVRGSLYSGRFLGRPIPSLEPLVEKMSHSLSFE